MEEEKKTLGAEEQATASPSAGGVSADNFSDVTPEQMMEMLETLRKENDSLKAERDKSREELNGFKKSFADAFYKREEEPKPKEDVKIELWK